MLTNQYDSHHPRWRNKVPAVVLSFWIIKILSTTVGETGADYLAFDAGWGLPTTTLIMGALLAGALWLQFRTRHYTPWIYWTNVILVSIVGTQITDLLTDAMGVSLYVSTAVFATLLVCLFAAWYRAEHTLSIKEIDSPRREAYYWAAILCTFALGTATGDLATEALGLGFFGGVLAFGAFIATTFAVWRMGGNAVSCFWIAYVLTRPFGASLGDLLTQEKIDGGLGIGTAWISAAFLAVIVLLVARAEFGMQRNRETLAGRLP